MEEQLEDYMILPSLQDIDQLTNFMFQVLFIFF